MTYSKFDVCKTKRTAPFCIMSARLAGKNLACILRIISTFAANNMTTSKNTQQDKSAAASIINGLSGKNLFFTSDTHFYHPNIIRYCNRPFNSVEEMNETLIRNWNEVVPPDGRVFHLGDFAFGGDAEWRSALSRLNGKIYLILGNHDIQNVKSEVMERFEAVTQQMLINVDGQKIILNHYPLLTFGGSYHNIWQLFGHVHSGPYTQTVEESARGKDIPRLINLFPTQYDVGVDNNEFRPVPFARLKEIIQAQVEGSNRK